MNADPRLTTVPVIIFSNAPMTEVPPDSPLGRSAKRLLKSDCTFSKLLETIQETLATAPEFVVIEAGQTPSTQPAAADNGKSKGDPSNFIPAPDSEAKAAKQRAEFLKEALAVMPKIREYSMGYIKAPNSGASQTHLSGLHQRVHLLNTSAAHADCARVALLTNAFDALLSGIMDKPSTVTPSVLQTIAQAVDCLDGLLKNNDGYSVGPPFQAKVLVVDDDTVCNHVNVTSLKRANFDAVGVKDPAAALSLLETTQYDLVVLDVNMPGMTGFDVCEKMRRLPHCKKTPVIFVTAFSNFDNRKQSVLSGGNDFVSKPVSPLELALKVTVNLIKARVQGVHIPQPETNPAPTNGSPDTPQPKRPAKAETPHPEPTNRLMPTAELGVKDAKTTGPIRKTQPEVEPPPASVPERTLQSKASTPNSQPGNGAAQSSEIHERLRQSTAGLERAKAGLEQESADRARLESQWREQLGAARALIGQTETVLKEKETRCSQLEKELAGLQQVRDELQNKFVTGQQAAAKSQQEIKELQERLHQGTAELEQTKAGLEKQAAEQTRLESEWREQLNAAKVAAGQTETVLKEKEARCSQLQKELAGLQQVRDELQNKFAAEQQAVAKSQQEAKELQERLRQGGVELERTRTSLEQESAKRARLESEHQTLAEAKEALNLELRGLRESQAAREAELRSKQTKLFQGLRENVLLLQSRLQEAENFTGDPGEASNGKPKSR
jgi:CheY-like chemotaxis protein